MNHIAIFGASGTIGSSLARRLVARGDRVLLVGRDQSKLAALGQEVQQPWVVADANNSQALESCLRSAEDAQGPLDSLVNCIGSVLLKPAHATSDEEFREVINANLFTSFAVVRAGARPLRSRGGCIVLFASAAAEIGIANHEAIAAAKGGVVGLARSAAATYAPRMSESMSSVRAWCERS